MYRSFEVAVSWTRCWAAAAPCGPPALSSPRASAGAAETPERGGDDGDGETVDPQAPGSDDNGGGGGSGGPCSSSAEGEEDCRQQEDEAGQPRWWDDDDGTPVLACQEVSNRILGCHQTFLADARAVRRELGLLRKNGGDGDGSSRASDGTGPGDPAVEEAPSSPGIVAEGAPDQDESSSELSREGRGADRPPPLVGYWAWEPSLRHHRLTLHLARHSDLALHVVLAVVMNQVRSERNALALAL
jgi:hypothetical protein